MLIIVMILGIGKLTLFYKDEVSLKLIWAHLLNVNHVYYGT